MSGKLITVIAVVAGVLLVIASLTADAIGTGGSPGFGFKQILGTIIGLVLIVAGIAAWPKQDVGPPGDS